MITKKQKAQGMTQRQWFLSLLLTIMVIVAIGSPVIREVIRPDSKMLYPYYGVITSNESSLLKLFHREAEAVSAIVSVYDKTGARISGREITIAPYSPVEIALKTPSPYSTVSVHTLDPSLTGEIVLRGEGTARRVQLGTGSTSAVLLPVSKKAMAHSGASIEREVIVQNLSISDSHNFQVIQYGAQGEVVSESVFSLPAMATRELLISEQTSAVKVDYSLPEASGARADDSTDSGEDSAHIEGSPFRAYVSTRTVSDITAQYADISELLPAQRGRSILPVTLKTGIKSQIELVFSENTSFYMDLFDSSGSKIEAQHNVINQGCDLGGRVSATAGRAIPAHAHRTIVCHFDQITQPLVSYALIRSGTPYSGQGHFYLNGTDGNVAGYSTAGLNRMSSFGALKGYFTPLSANELSELIYFNWNQPSTVLGQVVSGYFHDGTSRSPWGVLINSGGAFSELSFDGYTNGAVLALPQEYVSGYQLISSLYDPLDPTLEITSGFPGVHPSLDMERDDDGDSIPDVADLCPLDPQKVTPMFHGCGVAEDGEDCANTDTGCETDSSPTIHEAISAADVNNDGKVDGLDWQALQEALGSAVEQGTSGDVTGDGILTEADSLALSKLISIDANEDGIFSPEDFKVLENLIGKEVPIGTAGDVNRNGRIDEEDIAIATITVKAYRARSHPDINGDGEVNGSDIDIWLENYGLEGGKGDANRDGVVNEQDLHIISTASDLDLNQIILRNIQSAEDLILTKGLAAPLSLFPSGDVELSGIRYIQNQTSEDTIVDPERGYVSQDYLIPQSLGESELTAKKDDETYVANISVDREMKNDVPVTYREDTERYTLIENDVHPGWILTVSPFENIPEFEEYEDDEFMARIWRDATTKHEDLAGHIDSYDTIKMKAHEPVLLPNLFKDRILAGRYPTPFATKMLLSRSLNTLWVLTQFRWFDGTVPSWQNSLTYTWIISKVDLRGSKLLEIQELNSSSSSATPAYYSTPRPSNPSYLDQYLFPFSAADDDKLIGRRNQCDPLNSSNSSLDPTVLKIPEYDIAENSFGCREISTQVEGEEGIYWGTMSTLNTDTLKSGHILLSYYKREFNEETYSKATECHFRENSCDTLRSNCLLEHSKSCATKHLSECCDLNSTIGLPMENCCSLSWGSNSSCRQRSLTGEWEWYCSCSEQQCNAHQECGANPNCPTEDDVKECYLNHGVIDKTEEVPDPRKPQTEVTHVVLGELDLLDASGSFKEIEKFEYEVTYEPEYLYDEVQAYPLSTNCGRGESYCGIWSGPGSTTINNSTCIRTKPSTLAFYDNVFVHISATAKNYEYIIAGITPYKLTHISSHPIDYEISDERGTRRHNAIETEMNDPEVFFSQSLHYSKSVFGSKTHILHENAGSFFTSKPSTSTFQHPNRRSTLYAGPKHFIGPKRGLPTHLYSTINDDIIASGARLPEYIDFDNGTHIAAPLNTLYEEIEVNGTKILGVGYFPGIFSLESIPTVPAGTNGIFFMPMKWSPELLQTDNPLLSDLLQSGDGEFYESLVGDSAFRIPQHFLNGTVRCPLGIGTYGSRFDYTDGGQIVDPHKVPTADFFQAKDCRPASVNNQTCGEIIYESIEQELDYEDEDTPYKYCIKE